MRSCLTRKQNNSSPSIEPGSRGTSPAAARGPSGHPGCRCPQGGAPGVHGCQIPGARSEGGRVRASCSGVPPALLPSPGSPLYLIETAMRQAGILLVLCPYIRCRQAVTLPIDILPEAQWSHLGAGWGVRGQQRQDVVHTSYSNLGLQTQTPGVVCQLGFWGNRNFHMI